MDPAARAESLIRATRSIADPELRIAYLSSLVRERDPQALGPVLDVICARAAQAEPHAREVLLVLADAFVDPGLAEPVQRLREEAAGASLFALERVIRQPFGSSRPSALPEDPNEDRIPDYGAGRPLTLGERKALARRPDRQMLDRLVRDPHPAVIERLLANPKITEDDVLRMAAKRPARADVLTQISRSRFVHRPRVRLALVLNPDTPPDIVAPIAALLLRHELRLVIESTQVPAAVRALCIEHLERRPPSEDAGDGSLQ